MQLLSHPIGRSKRGASTLSVGQLAKRVGLNIQTVRYYEREGLLPEPERTSGGHRLYSEEDILRLQFIQGAKDCGFTLREIADLMQMRDSDIATCTDVRERAKAKLAETEHKLKQMNTLKKHLKKLIADCPGGDVGVDCCNIISDLEKPNRKRRK